MSKKIEFTKNLDYVDDKFVPKPAKAFIPEWYKNTEPFVEGRNLVTENNMMANASIKKCIPVLDALTSGYIITSYADVYVIPNKDPYFENMELDDPMAKPKPGDPQWINGHINSIEFHPHGQAKLYPIKDGRTHSYPKWINAWGIKTPPGYSCLFINPMNNPNDIFSILSGVVDTDVYTEPVNFPFIMNDKDFEGMIPAGTPIAQVIPFKRDSWESEIQEAERKQSNGLTKNANKLHTRLIDRYKNIYWNKKQYN